MSERGWGWRGRGRVQAQASSTSTQGHAHQEIHPSLPRPVSPPRLRTCRPPPRPPTLRMGRPPPHRRRPPRTHPRPRWRWRHRRTGRHPGTGTRPWERQPNPTGPPCPLRSCPHSACCQASLAPPLQPSPLPESLAPPDPPPPRPAGRPRPQPRPLPLSRPTRPALLPNAPLPRPSVPARHRCSLGQPPCPGRSHRSPSHPKARPARHSCDCFTTNHDCRVEHASASIHTRAHGCHPATPSPVHSPRCPLHR